MSNKVDQFKGEDGEVYVKFSVAAKLCDVRFQQVYQRAVGRGKMKWFENGKFKVVRLKDVEEWREFRIREGYIKG